MYTYLMEGIGGNGKIPYGHIHIPSSVSSLFEKESFSIAQAGLDLTHHPPTSACKVLRFQVSTHLTQTTLCTIDSHHCGVLPT